MHAAAQYKPFPFPLPMRSYGKMITLQGLYYYPIKGLSGQVLDETVLAPERGLPFDRAYALARPGTQADPAAPRWARKTEFLALMQDEKLASVATLFDPATQNFSVTQDRENVLSTNFATRSGRETAERFSAPPVLVGPNEGEFMDKSHRVISLINLATLRELEQRWRKIIDPLRFRANLYIDGAEPWAEFDWIGQEVAIEDARLHVESRNRRCPATNVNPASGKRDMNVPDALMESFGHRDLGVYLAVRQGGRIAIGNQLKISAAKLAAD
jgi:GntR family transcriptional regulator/MocR family aminotransferase